MQISYINEKYIKNPTNSNSKVIEAKYIVKNGIRYYVDGKNVILDYTKNELEIAKYLVSTLEGTIYLLPRINFPKNIKTADYLWNNEFWDLKEINGKGKNILDNRIKNYQNQSNNFIFVIKNNKFSIKNIILQINKIYNSPHRLWVNKIIIIKNNKLLMIIKRD